MSLRRAGLQCSGVCMVVSTVDPGAQELQRYGRLWRACPIKKKCRVYDTRGIFSLKLENSWADLANFGLELFVNI
uniref:SFRICE_026465 n=1 Tax=Spodoptera frugiperda TaxID=7108 RepID=A0A2H1VIK7_SPOFR